MGYSDRQALTALGASGAKHSATAFGAHAGTKAVDACAVEFAGLVGSFHLGLLPCEWFDWRLLSLLIIRGYGALVNAVDNFTVLSYYNGLNFHFLSRVAACPLKAN